MNKILRVILRALSPIPKSTLMKHKHKHTTPGIPPANGSFYPCKGYPPSSALEVAATHPGLKFALTPEQTAWVVKAHTGQQ